MKIIVYLLIFISLNCYATDFIDEKLVLDLLEKEKRFVQNKDIEGFISLISEDFSGFRKDGAPLTKDDFRQGAFVSFLNASKILHNSKIESLSISENKQSAEVILENETKFLIERGDYKTVISNKSKTRSKLVLDNGILKYKNNSYIK